MKVATALKSDSFPKGYFYCHQCNKKRDILGEYSSCHSDDDTDFHVEGIQCTLKDTSSNIQNARCKAKYCEPCLRNRYEANMQEIKTHTTAEMTRRERDRHVPNVDYVFE